MKHIPQILVCKGHLVESWMVLLWETNFKVVIGPCLITWGCKAILTSIFLHNCTDQNVVLSENWAGYIIRESLFLNPFSLSSLSHINLLLRIVPNLGIFNLEAFCWDIYPLCLHFCGMVVHVITYKKQCAL